MRSPLLQTEEIYQRLPQDDMEETSLLMENPLLLSDPTSPSISVDSVNSPFLPNTNFKKTSIDFFRVSTYFEVLLTIVCVVFLILFGIFAVQMFHLNLDYDEDSYQTPPPGALYLSLLGDSLINRPCKFFNFRGRLNALTGMSMNISNFGHDGDTISEIAARLPKAIAGPPDALFLFWDSDCSDINEYGMTLAQKATNRHLPTKPYLRH